MEIDGTKKVGDSEREEELPLARGQGQARSPPWLRVGAMNPTMVPELLGRGTTIR